MSQVVPLDLLHLPESRGPIGHKSLSLSLSPLTWRIILQEFPVRRLLPAEHRVQDPACRVNLIQGRLEVVLLRVHHLDNLM